MSAATKDRPAQTAKSVSRSARAQAPHEQRTACESDEDFAAPARAGKVVGRPAPNGKVRKGIDVERVIAIDNGALRIQPLLQPGWGRAGLAWGPYTRENGLAFTVFMVNGHNTAQSENLTETLRARLDRWLVGPEVFRRRQRLRQFLFSRRRSRMLRQWRWWHRISKDAPPVPRVDENLAVGWFASEVPTDPLAEGNAFVMHATGAENGELWARVGSNMLAAVRGVQNLPIHYVVVLREQGAAYYAASLSGANGLGSYPALRPLGIDPFNSERVVHAGLFQATLGQIGFRLDTRVYGARVAQIAAWAAWYGTAHAADLLAGSGALAGSADELGARWLQSGGGLRRTRTGTEATEADGMAVLRPAAPSGLLHLVIKSGTRGEDAVGLVWRHADADNFWQVTISTTGAELVLHVAGRPTTIARSEQHRLVPGATHSLQVLDDGRRFGLHLNGALLFDTRFDDARLHAATGVGIALPGAPSGVRLSRFEAHPLHCPLPEVLDQGAPWWRLGQDLDTCELFEGAARDLAGKITTTGAKVWERTLGRGAIRLDGAGVGRVSANAEHENPGRLVYTIDWQHADFADLAVEITPPGARRGETHKGRGGLVFWQDQSNYVLVNNWLNDNYPGASVSCFCCLGGFEDLYDAVWSNVGDRIRWGVNHRLRVVFDGMHLLVLLDGEPVLYRALTDIYPDASRLQIRRVGLLANWEWGNDTGSAFRRFEARS